MTKKSTNSKKRRTTAADKYNSRTRAETAPAKSNPFDHHVNRLKHDVLGKKRNYERGGQPLKARSRGIEKRKRTLLKELNSVFKKGSFVDHRIGENDPTLSNDEKLMQRLIAERTKVRAGKDSRYNLNDEEDLTHYGQSLSKSDEMNQKPVVDDYDDDDGRPNQGRLNSEHFFGGFNGSDEQRKPQSKKEWIDDMIKSTKLDKYERQRENEKVFDMTATLDEQWKALSLLMGIKDKKPKETKEVCDDYDKLVNSLKFEAKTTGLPVKSIEEKEKEDAERLKQLKLEESKRMERPTLKSVLSKNKQQTHRSVEDLDESYYAMDRSQKHVEFDETEAPTDAEPNGEAEPIDNGGEVEEEQEEEEETTNGDLTAEYAEIPSTVDLLQARLREEKSTLNIVWKRINDKRLPAIPKSVLSNYFDVLLDHYESMTESQTVLNQTGKHLLQLLQLVNNEQSRTNIVERLKQHHLSFQEVIEKEKFCQADQAMILFLKLVAHLYPTSDFRHPIITPAITLLVQALHHASLSTLTSCRNALTLVELAKQWISKSHRYVPEVLVLLMQLSQLACPSDKARYVVSCSSKQVKDSQLLVLKTDVAPSSSMKVTFFETDDLDDDNDVHRAFILQTTVDYIADFLQTYQSLSAIAEISRPFEMFLSTIADACPSTQISSRCREISTMIESMCRTERKHLEQGKEQTKILKLFEPRFGPVYEGKKINGLSKEHNERNRLRQRHKRDFKATVRTLVLDTEFVAREELDQQMKKDAQRKRKVKDIYAQASMQEGEYRKAQKLA